MNEKDETTIWLNEELAALLREEVIKKKELATISAKVKDAKIKIKEYMRKEKIKTINVHGLKITYTPPRKYEDLYNKKMTLKYLKETRPDMVVSKEGYERITISLKV